MDKKKKSYCRRKLLLLEWLCVFVLTGCGTNREEESGMEDGSQEPGQSIVQVCAGDLWGSGVIYDKTQEEMIIATAAHVLAREQEQVTVSFGDGSAVPAESCFVSQTADLAFLKVSLEGQPEVVDGLAAVRKDKDVFDALTNGTDVWLLGAGEKEPVYAFVEDPWILVEDFGQYMLLLRGRMVPGMSGGGAFDQNGIFLGILCGADEDGRVAAVPYSIVEAEYENSF